MVNMIALGVVTLMQHPEQLRELKGNSALVPSFVSELCRYHTGSSMAMRRVAKEDIELGGKIIRAGEGIIAANQSASRDEDIFPDPDKFDLHRKPKHDALGFGYGPHRCIAELLAKTEMEIVFETLFKTLPNLRVAIPLEEIEYTPRNRDVGVVKLPVVW
ncbi:cytochrome p450 55a3 [Fusarium longipes]|uniref:Cytochrome p450 55a3 n=1 Tax=Fusarium longipes TaxID=694270 RepID=A0A395T1P1_9HYPO|nr:cytochrome p450 55a3 [Fusarium longipes]